MARLSINVGRNRILPRRLPEGSDRAELMERVASVLRHEVSARSPVDTGELRRKTRVVVSRGGWRIILGVPYGSYVHEIYDDRNKDWVDAAIVHTRRIVRAALRRFGNLRRVPGPDTPRHRPTWRPDRPSRRRQLIIMATTPTIPLDDNTLRSYVENIIDQLYSKANGQAGAPKGIAAGMSNNDVLRNLKWYVELWREMGTEKGKSEAFDQLLEEAREKLKAVD